MSLCSIPLSFHGKKFCSLQSLMSTLTYVVVFSQAGPVGFDPTTTGSGGLCSVYIVLSAHQHPVLAGRRTHSFFTIIRSLLVFNLRGDLLLYPKVSFKFIGKIYDILANYISFKYALTISYQNPIIYSKTIISDSRYCSLRICTPEFVDSNSCLLILPN